MATTADISKLDIGITEFAGEYSFSATITPHGSGEIPFVVNGIYIPANDDVLMELLETASGETLAD